MNIPDELDDPTPAPLSQGQPHQPEPPAASAAPPPAQGAYRYDAFVSFNDQDSDWVYTTLLPRLEREQLRLCVADRDFEIGVPKLINIENAVEHSRKTLLILTPNWIASEWAKFEGLLVQTSDPSGLGRRILPLMAQPCTLPAHLQIFTYLDLTKPSELDFQIQRLVAAIQAAPAQPGPVAPSPAPAIRQSRGGFDHERGLDGLSALLATADVETRLNFAVLESRLRDNLKDERLFGTYEAIRNDRARIMLELNRLALVKVGRSFNELCGA
jgi:hypothetical protein